jgi:acetoin utilization deacetylase AcuC-like enzyme
MEKYRMLRDAVSVIDGIDLLEAPTTSDGVLALAHDPRYVAAVSQGQLSPDQQRAIGFPWSFPMVERSRRSTGATIAACKAALSEGVAVNLAGGTHHAHADRGEGFCVFNDGAVAARLMQAERKVHQVAIIDLDVHQGNGTASILARDESVFTLSLHGQHNYPFKKEVSDLDFGLADGTQDAAYLSTLNIALETLFDRCSPQLIIYLAGADAHEGDRLGRLKLTTAGLAERDAMVFERAASRSIAVAVTMGGGYGNEIADSVAIHLQTVKIAARYAHSTSAAIALKAANADTSNSETFTATTDDQNKRQLDQVSMRSDL